MRFAPHLLFAAASFLVGCAGSIGFELPEDSNGIPINPELTLVPGSQGQAELSLLAEGVYAGAYTISATPDDPLVLTAIVSPTQADVKDGVILPVLVTIDVSSQTSETFGSVYVEAAKDGSPETTAGTSVLVNVAQPL
jgi:hypothetical protein